MAKKVSRKQTAVAAPNARNLLRSQVDPRAAQAIAALDCGDVDTALCLAMEVAKDDGAHAMFQANRTHIYLASRQIQGVANSAAKRQRLVDPKLQNAIEEYARLLEARNSGGKDSNFTLRKRAARHAGISERHLRDNMPAYLK